MCSSRDHAASSSESTGSQNQAPTFTSANSTTFTVGVSSTFTVTASGSPTPTLTGNGRLPNGVTFDDATGILSGTPLPGTGGIYDLTFTASNSSKSIATQNFILSVNQAPAFTSNNATTFAVGASGSFTVTASGFPTPTISESGALPTSLSFNTSTDILSGTPQTGTGGTYPLVFTASNGVGSSVTQQFTLTIDVAPRITSVNNTTFTVGTNGSFKVTATGSPTPTLAGNGLLPNGVVFDDGTGLLSGTPLPGTGGTYVLTFAAANGVSPDASQAFVLTVDAAPSIVSNSSTTFAVGTAGTFTVTAHGFPAPTFTEVGRAASRSLLQYGDRSAEWNAASGQRRHLPDSVHRDKRRRFARDSSLLADRRCGSGLHECECHDVHRGDERNIYRDGQRRSFADFLRKWRVAERRLIQQRDGRVERNAFNGHRRHF